jgi:hypothetical protein
MRIKPRNHLVAHAHRRKAGAHGSTRKAQRSADKRELNKQVKEVQ